MAESIIDNSLQEQINDLNSNLIRIKEISIPVSATIASHGGVTVFDNYDISSYLDSGATVVAILYEWSNGSGCYAGNTAVFANNKIVLTLYNGANNSVTISSVRMLVFYKK